MFRRIVWRPRALVWNGLIAVTGLLLAAALLTPTTMPAHAGMSVVPMHAAMSPAAHAAMLAAPTEDAPARIAKSARPAGVLADAIVVDIQAFQFSAPTLSVAAGTTVTWTNHDVEPHTVTSNDRAFSSAGLETDDSFAFRFDTPGTYVYHCALHPFMTGQVVVQ